MDLMAGLSFKVCFEVLEFLPSKTSDQIDKLTGLIPRLIAKVDAQFEAERTFNEKCNVHLPGLGLLMIDEIEMRENYCTDELKGDLENGWRIVACCPQPDQRRPDYVLGRTKKDEN